MTRHLEKALATRLRAQGAESSDPSSSIDAVAAAVERERPDLGAHSSPGGDLTIAFSDIEGFTALTERLGEQRAHAILRAHNAIVREQVAEHGGLIIKSQGDGFMFAFPDARRGLRCAVAIQRALADRGARNQEEAIRVRIGLHTGRVIEEPDDLHGRNVILAARIADQAAGGEVVVSTALKELVEGDADVELGEPREAVLKGLAGSHRLFPVRWHETPGPRRPCAQTVSRPT